MEIIFDDIPGEGLPVAGEVPAALFNLGDRDSIRIEKSFQYDITVFKAGDAVLLTGKITGEAELQCVSCLQYFPYHAVLPDWQSDLEIEEGETKFDPAEFLRDEILLSLPSLPRCDQFLSGRACPKAEIVDQYRHSGEPLVSEEAVEEGNNTAWSALDDL